jgi:aspartyl/asparaginyl beta-hydroxylase (cupin superfamily)
MKYHSFINLKLLKIILFIYNNMFIYIILIIIFYYLFKNKYKNKNKNKNKNKYKYKYKKRKNIYVSKSIYPLTNNWLDIRVEALNRMKFSKQQNGAEEGLSCLDIDLNHEGWIGQNELFDYGLIHDYEYFKKNCSKCPKTTKLLERIKGVKMAAFSWLQPNSKIEEQVNNNLGFNTYHLGLSVPDNCILSVKQNQNWKHYTEDNGTMIKFDDGNVHYSENNSKEDRVILYILMEK